MPSRHHLAIDLGRRRLRALLATHRGKSLKVQRVLIEQLPADLDPQDAEQVGAWVAATLREAGLISRRGGFGGPHAVIALSRETIGVKRMSLPTTDDAELPDMVRFALQRELNFDVDHAVIDYLPIRKTDTETNVLAMALPNTALEFSRAMARAAGLRNHRITVRTLGVAALLQTDGYWSDRPVMIVDVTGDGVEFSVIEDGATRFSRGTDIGQGGSADDQAQHVITESKRTWMSYRILEGAANVTHALLFGEADVVGPVSVSLDKLLDVPVAIMREHPLVDTSAMKVQVKDGTEEPAADQTDGASEDLRSAWPLAGLILREVRGLPMINFAAPRKAPDIGAQRRVRIMAVGGFALLLIMAIAMYCYVDLLKLQRQRDRVIDEQRAALVDYREFQRDVDLYEHIWHWEQVRADWLAHLQHLADIARADRGPRTLVLDGMTGVLDFRRVEWDRREDEWRADSEIRIVIEGEAQDRATADTFRAQLVESDRYTASSTGADAAGGQRLPFGFTYQLRTRDPSPVDADDNDAATDDDAERTARRTEGESSNGGDA